MKKSIYLILILLISACGTLKTPYYSDNSETWQSKKSTSKAEIAHTLYLVGDAGALDDAQTGKNYVLSAVAKKLESETKKSSLVFLGDNIYPAGLPEKDSEKRLAKERILNAQLDIARNHKGKTYFVAGNHDWNHYNEGGLDAIKREEKYVESYFANFDKSEEAKEKVNLLPSKGCGDPDVVKINKDLVFIFVDSQWLLHNWQGEKKMNKGCDIKSRGDFLERIERLFTEHKNDQIVLMMHHPIKSNGMHGGNFTLKHHIFPLHELNIWLPLPVIGSIYPIYRKTTGSVQDIPNQENEKLIGGIDKIAKKLGVNVIFAAGHEHNLQYFGGDKIQYLISGSGAKSTYARRGGEVDYARQARGFVKLNFYENFETWAEYYTVSGFNQEPKLDYRVQIREPRAGTVASEIEFPNLTSKDTTFAVNDEFGARGFKKAILGGQYREMWTTPVKVPMINLETKFAGLTPIKKGGGMSSNSLRMERADGKQFILRSIKKDYTKLVPAAYANLKVLDIMKDQNSASHPYGSLVLPKLSKAANIYYTSPQLVYLKHQKKLGNYNSLFPEELYLLEQRPTGDWSDAEQFGNSKKIIGYTDLLDKLQNKKKHFIDQKWVLKSRLFDLWVHDWDRHDDQWRWASFKNDGKTTYRPIPRDRDQVFYKFEGVLPKLVAAFFIKKFKGMKDDVKDVKSLSFNARYFDRYFLNSLEWKDWEAIIDTLQSSLTDEIINEAMLEIPEEVQKFDNPEIIRMLKSRRDKLKPIAKKLYDFISKEVEIVGTDNKDRFEIQRNQDGSVLVKHFVKQKSEEDILKFERTFYPNETKEIRLYGLDKKDEFEILGADNSKIAIKIIGGEGKDLVKNSTNSGKIKVYDQTKGIKLEGKHLKDKTSNALGINHYDRKAFKYNTGIPKLVFGYTVDDQFWFGAGYNWTRHGWRKSPYKSRQHIDFSEAPFGREAHKLHYWGHFPDLFGKIDFVPLVSLNFPRYENFFGLGNNSVNLKDEITYNWVRLQTFSIEPLLQTKFLAGNLKFGAILQFNDIKLSEDRVSNDVTLGFTEAEMKSRFYGGIKLEHELNYVDNKVFPTNGFRLKTAYSYLRELNKKENVTEFDVQLDAYIKIMNRPKLVFANSLGYKKADGDLQFHQYVDLGNTTSLRGFRNNRFRGEAAFYHNVDLRLHLFKWSNTILPMEVGILGGYDYGRVWFEHQNSSTWHSSQTVGLWLNIMGLAVLQPYYSFVEEGDRFSFKMGFNF